MDDKRLPAAERVTENTDASGPGGGPAGSPGGSALSGLTGGLVWVGPVDILTRMPLEQLAVEAGVVLSEAELFPLTLVSLSGVLEEGQHPAIVVSPLFWRNGDVMEVARLLSAARYDGPYRVVTPPLPHPGMVRGEVRSAHPKLDFDLISIERG